MHRRRTDRRGRPRKPDAQRRRTTLAGRRPPSDPGTDELRRRKRAATGREDLEVNGAAVLYGHDLLDRAQYDTLGTVTELLQRVGRAWGQRDGNLNGLWEAITGALTGTSFAPAPVAATRSLTGRVGDYSACAGASTGRALSSSSWPKGRFPRSLFTSSSVA